MKISAVILAAGESKRMGSPKQLLKFQDKTLLSHAIDSVQPLLSEIKVVLGANYDEVSQAIKDQPVDIVKNERWSDGLSASLTVGIGSLSVDVDGVLIMLCDQPLIPASFLALLVDEFLSEKITICSGYQGITGVPAIFPRSLFGDLMSLEGEKGAGSLLKTVKKIILDCPNAASDVDTMKDFRSLIQ